MCGERSVPHARGRDREAAHVRWAERGGAWPELGLRWVGDRPGCENELQ